MKKPKWSNKKEIVEFVTNIEKASEKFEGFKFINPLVVEDNVITVINLARRLLEYEQFIDKLEHIKSEKGSLPLRVEQHIAEAALRAQLDANSMIKAFLDTLNEYRDARVLEQMIPSVARCLQNIGKLQMDIFLPDFMDTVGEIAERYGLARTLIQWALKNIDLSGAVLSSKGDMVVFQRKKQLIYIVERDSNPLPTISGSAFVENKLYQRLVGDSSSVIEGIPNITIYGSFVGLSKRLVESYEKRALKYKLYGLEVLPTGVPWVVILFIVLIVAVVTVLLCSSGLLDKDAKMWFCVILLPFLLWSASVSCEEAKKQGDDCIFSASKDGEDGGPFPG